MSQLPTLPIDIGRTTADRLPTPVYTPEQKRERDAQRDDGYLGRTAVDLARSEWVTSAIFRQAAGLGYEPDLNFRLDADAVLKYGEGLPDDWLDEFGYAVSDADAQRIRGNLLRLAESRRRLEELGYKGTALRLAAGVLDPVNIAAAFASGGIGASAQASRLANFMRAGLVNVAATVPIEGYRITQDPDAQASDLLIATTAAFALGGAGGLWKGGRLRKAALNLQRAVELDEINANGGTLNPKGTAYFRNQVPSAVGDSLSEFAETTARVDAAIEAAAGIGERLSAIDTAIDRVAALDPTKPLSRSEVDDILAGTGYKTANQGWPTPEDMVGYLAGMKAKILSQSGQTVDAAVALADAGLREIPPVVESPRLATNPPTIAEAGTLPPSQTGGEVEAIGAASPSSITRGVQINRQPGELDFSSDISRIPTTADPAAKSLRFGIGAQMARSKNPITQQIGRMLVRENLIPADGSPVARSATEEVERQFRTRMIPYQRSHLSGFDAYLKERNIAKWNVRQVIKARRDFNREVLKAVRRPPGSYTTSRSINAAADAFRNLQKGIRDYAERFQVKGFDSIPASDTYAPRLVNPAKLHRAINTHGFAEVQRWVEGAMGSANPSLTGQALSDKAKQYLTILQSVGESTHFDREAALDALLFPSEKMAGPAKASVESGESARSMARQQLDEAFELNTPTGRITIDDIFEDDVEALAHIYTRQMVGHAAMAEVYRGASLATGREITDTDELLAAIKSEADGRALRADDDLANVKLAADVVRGVPLGGHGVFAEATRSLQRLNFLTRGGGFAFAQVSEVGLLLSEGGLRAAMRQMPVMRKIIWRMKDGTVNDQLLNEILTVWGPGQDRLLRQVVSRISYDDGALRTGGPVDFMLRRAGRALSDISGLHWINRVLKESAAVIQIQKFADAALTGKGIDEARLKSIGISERQAQDIYANIKQHATFDGNRLTAINFDKWDAQSASDFIIAVDKWSRKVIQENDIGEYAKWMTTDTGRIFTQFRSFGISAWESATLGNIQQLRQGNFRAFLTIVLPGIFGGLAYAARTYLDSIGRQDREKFLDQRLSVEAMARAAFNRAPASSLLPMAVDTMAEVGGYDPIFSFARTSGLEGDVLFGNPTFDVLAKYKDLVPVNAAIDSEREYTRQNFRALRTLIPFQNLVGVKNVLDYVESGLPNRTSP